jgi:hypothetical protein
VWNGVTRSYLGWRNFLQAESSDFLSLCGNSSFWPVQRDITHHHLLFRRKQFFVAWCDANSVSASFKPLTAKSKTTVTGSSLILWRNLFCLLGVCLYKLVLHCESLRDINLGKEASESNHSRIPSIPFQLDIKLWIEGKGDEFLFSTRCANNVALLIALDSLFT